MNKIFSILLILISHFSLAQNAIRLTQVTGNLSLPVYLTHAGDDRIFVIEKQGRIRIIQNGILLPDPYLNIVSKVNSRGNEQGLLGMAFHPDYASNGKFYVNYSAQGAGNTIVAEYLVRPNNPNKADSLSERILINIPQPYGNHNGGCIKFGMDRYLYIGMGDGGSGGDPQNYAQNPKSLLGKMLRIDVDTTVGYKIPPSNPFVGSLSLLPEIWSIGLRNPWRFSFDRLTGDQWIGDVGQGEWEEINFQASNSSGGENYGWRCYEGDATFNLNGCAPRNTYVFPVIAYKGDESVLGCSVTGGYVYRADSCSYLYGKYIYGDYCSGIVWGLDRQSDTSFNNQRMYTHTRFRLSSFGEDHAGNLYLVDIGTGGPNGAIFRISDTCNLSIREIISNPSCDGKSDGKIEITNGGSNLKFLWSNGDSTASIQNLAAGSYSVTVSQGQCMVKKDFLLQNSPAKIACITPILKANACEGDTIMLIACDESELVTYQWYLDSVLVENSNQKNFPATKSGSYTLKTLDQQGCLSESSPEIEITIHPKPAKPEIRIIGDTLRTDPGFITYNWFLDGIFQSSSTDPELILSKRGFYQLSVIDHNNCESPKSDSIFLVPSFLDNPNADFLRIYPNPGTGLFRLDLDARIPKPVVVSVFDQKAGLILSQTNKESLSPVIIDLQQIPDGLYFLEVTSIQTNIRQRIKILKQSY
ncbi:MAG: PQQ-dependent sugar dehydrogenase [Saprospiraceae bacterium]|nr:PQQ-dependent sugar dehydrogenase [Saprospiraceae bacterium]